MNKLRHIATIAGICLLPGIAPAQRAMPGPHVLVYTTKKNYSKQVPVILSADRKTITSYPDPTDIKNGGKKIRPVQLHKGYWLSPAGVGTHTAFLALTYDAYAALPQPPAVEEMYKGIKDKQPVAAVYDCGPKSHYKHVTAEINHLIDADSLTKKCTIMK